MKKARGSRSTYHCPRPAAADSDCARPSLVCVDGASSAAHGKAKPATGQQQPNDAGDEQQMDGLNLDGRNEAAACKLHGQRRAGLPAGGNGLLLPPLHQQARKVRPKVTLVGAVPLSAEFPHTRLKRQPRASWHEQAERDALSPAAPFPGSLPNSAQATSAVKERAHTERVGEGTPHLGARRGEGAAGEVDEGGVHAGQRGRGSAEVRACGARAMDVPWTMCHGGDGAAPGGGGCAHRMIAAASLWDALWTCRVRVSGGDGRERPRAASRRGGHALPAAASGGSAGLGRGPRLVCGPIRHRQHCPVVLDNTRTGKCDA